MRESDRRLVEIVPTMRQLKHQQMEFYGFIHFTVNTFTGKEWGEGTESPEIFDPKRLDAGQWARAAKDGGMRGLILTCKHHVSGQADIPDTVWHTVHIKEAGEISLRNFPMPAGRRGLLLAYTYLLGTGIIRHMAAGESMTIIL